MVNVILDILKKPHLLAQSTLIKKSFMRKVIVFLACCVAIPSIINNIIVTHQFQNDFNTIANHLPQFSTANGVITSNESQKSSAIQTNSSYLLFDIDEVVPNNVKNDLIANNTFTFFITKTQYNIAIGQYKTFTFEPQNTDISTQSVAENLNVLSNAMTITLFLAPILSILVTCATLLFNNFFYALAARVFFLINNKIVNFTHLWRVSLFASILPYFAITLLKIFGLSTPYEHIVILIYTLYIQHYVLKNVSK